ncbi:MAG TPA: YbaY family lipoprotein [Burkholderiaceae bacterium]|nr:YbaY family lipoprotein [Burkholderiaceae bacterium]
MLTKESLALLVGALTLAACGTAVFAPSSTGSSASARVSGTVAYQERLALRPGVVIKVQLANVSRTDAPAIVIGEQIIKTDGNQMPFRFEIPFDPAAIKPQNTYAVSARMEDANGRLRFITDQHYAVITRGAPTHVDLVLRQVSAP